MSQYIGSRRFFVVKDVKPVDPKDDASSVVAIPHSSRVSKAIVVGKPTHSSSAGSSTEDEYPDVGVGDTLVFNDPMGSTEAVDSDGAVVVHIDNVMCFIKNA